MLAIITTNLLRRSARTLFTALGIAVGVATIVALLSFTQGLKETAAGFVHLGGSELGVFQANVSDPTASLLPESLVGRLDAQPGGGAGHTAVADRRRREGRPVGDRVRRRPGRVLHAQPRADRRAPSAGGGA